MRMQAKLTSKGWTPETMQAVRFLFASEEELQAAESWNPVRWITQLLQQWQPPTFGYSFDKPQSYATETRVDQVCMPATSTTCSCHKLKQRHASPFWELLGVHACVAVVLCWQSSWHDAVCRQCQSESLWTSVPYRQHYKHGVKIMVLVKFGCPEHLLRFCKD